MPRSPRSSALTVISFLLFLTLSTEAKTIRLRNEVIATDVPTRLALAPADGSSLNLVQFDTPPDAEQRERLRAAGVELLQYVPEDAYIARLTGSAPSTVRTFPGVHWVGPYRPEHKIHSAVLAKTKSLAVGESLGLTVLLAPGIDAGALRATRGLLAQLTQESTTRAGTVLRGKASPAQLDALLRSDAVLWVEPEPAMRLFDEVASKIVAGDGGPNKLYTQSLGYDGSGVTVAVADSGLDTGEAATMHPDLLGRTPAFFAYGGLPDASDEHSHGTHVAGIIAGNGAVGETDENGALYGLGVAPGASIIGQRMFDAVGNYYPPPSYEKLTRDATGAGAVIGSNSWGDDTQGRYDVSAMEFDALVRDADALKLGDQQYILEFSAGNAGPGTQTIGSPAVGKNVIATGASQNDRVDFIIYGDGIDAMADFSSRGPCEDGRIKPDIVAPGTWISSLQSSMASDIYAWSGISSYYQYQGGTSQAGPHASGAAAVFVQYYRETHAGATPSPALVKAALINSAVDMNDASGTAPIPNNDEGWGRIDLQYLFDPTVTFVFTDQTVTLTNQQVYEERVVVSGRDEFFKATLTYSDVPGFPGAIPALVNDLDLEVIDPDGNLYHGNQFLNGQSVPNVPNHDAINNVEGVHIANPTPGEYLIRVRARGIYQDARLDTPAVDQDFALVVSATMAAPHVGTIILDRDTYTAPGLIKLTLIDSDLAGQPSATIQLRSTTETVAETVQLLASRLNGIFTGAVATATGPALPDGKLQISHNDTIEAIYQDAGTTRTATALADLVPPVISNVSATNSFGRATIKWTTDEAATSVVRYGTNAAFNSLTQATTNSTLTTEHNLELENLVTGKRYYLYVVSADAAGNTQTNSNNGAFYTFMVEAAATVLLIDEYQDPFFDAPPLDGYTAPLQRIGVTYDIWDAGTEGEPTLAVLSRYPAVIWRVPELSGVWTAAERGAISNYLSSGGAMMVASMELFSRLQENGASDFIQNVLHVSSFVADPDSTGAAQIIGVANDQVAGGLDTPMDYSIYETIWFGFAGPDLSDTFTPGTDASPVFHNDVGDTVGMRWPGLGKEAPGKLVLLSFPLDAVPMADGVNDRVALLRNSLAFLAPGAPGLSKLTLDSTAYTLPSRVDVEFGDSDYTGQRTLQVQATTDFTPNGIQVTLTETVKPGVFKGFLEVIPSTNSPGTGEIRAQPGDTLTVAFADPATKANFTATAVIDTVSPVIVNPAVEPDYEQATISWETSEPTDALVQFGESILLGRTGYRADYTTFHSVILPGLAPNRTYYYRLVSRDIAGNTVTDDNKGKLYTFKTLMPLVPPWSDNMDKGDTGWSVYSPEGGQSEWRLGVPNNGDVTNAYSPPNAWCSNLNGDPIDTCETFLISPAILLTNGNTASLTFAHTYDFTPRSEFDIIEMGELSIVTNSSGMTTLAQYGDASGGWTHEQINLTPYMGKVVYLVWHYVVFSFDTVSRPGWVVDDVAVTTTTVQPGTIEITNNISQAVFVLSGGTYLKGRGVSTILTNAAPGEYIIEYAEVPYYVTPAAQTNILQAGGTIRFVGDYTFTDTNGNGLPDAWELAYFGKLDPGHSASTDTDKDGMSDYAEFVAGTNPTNAASNLEISVQLSSTSGSAVLRWTGASGHAYDVQGSIDGTNWVTVAQDVIAPSNVPMQYAIPATETNRLFRLAVKP